MEAITNLFTGTGEIRIDVLDLRFIAWCLLWILAAVIAYLVVFTKAAYRWQKLSKACGGEPGALQVLAEMEAARKAYVAERDARTDEQIRRGGRVARSLRLVK